MSQLTITKCNNLELFPVEDGGLWDLRMLQSFSGHNCGKLFSRWNMGEVGGGSYVIKPFPTSLTKLEISFEPSMQSMGLFSNLTSLTSLSLTSCTELRMDGFDPHMIANLKKLLVDSMYFNEEGISLSEDLLSEIARSTSIFSIKDALLFKKSTFMHSGSFQLEELSVNSISAVLTAPICSHLAGTLHTVQFNNDHRATIFIKKQEDALHLLISLRRLEFQSCSSLESLPRGLHSLPSLKILAISGCRKILSLPAKGLPASLETLKVHSCSPELTKQAQKLVFGPDY
jgi:Leucine-rich repeat (LRR) protein